MQYSILELAGQLAPLPLPRLAHYHVNQARNTADLNLTPLRRIITPEPVGVQGSEERFPVLIAHGPGKAQPPPLIFRQHVILLKQAMEECGTRLYLKIGTTGTGGMGLNIPYTHGEDKPSAALMSKTAIAFAHTGLLFLMARTVGSPVV